MNEIKKIAGYNLLVLLIYTILLHFTGGGPEKSLNILVFSAIIIGIHVLVDLVACAYFFSNHNKPMGKAWLLSAGIVLVIGFSTCLGSASF